MENDTETKKMGRPSLYSEKLVDEICEKISSSHYGLEHICENNPDLPCRATICLWIKNNKYFSDKYAEAKAQQAELMVEQIFKIADDKDVYYADEFGSSRVDSGKVQQMRLQTEVRKWYVSKVLPKIYGDKITNVLEDSEGKGIALITLNIPKLSTDQPQPE